MTIPPTLPPRAPDRPSALASRDPDDARLLKAAQALERSFLSEMLDHAGLGKVPDSFGGGAGETQFASFLRDAQAGAIVDHGGIGLAEQLFHALKERVDGRD